MGIWSRSRGNKGQDPLAEFDRDERSAYPGKVNVTHADAKTVAFIRTTRCRMVAEIGIYEGHTSIEIAKFLDGQGELHLYDFEDRVKAVEAELAAQSYTNVRGFGCSYKLLDSYNWPLAKMVEQHPQPIYDYVFLDGAHTWAIDALTTFLADRLLVVGGYLDLDDYDWTLGTSRALKPSAHPMTARMYTTEQIEARQVKMIADLILRRDPRYAEIVPDKIWQKIA